MDNAKIKEYQRQIEELLKERPHLRSFQKHIEKVLEEAGTSSSDRMAVLGAMMSHNVMVLSEHMKSLTGLTNEYITLKGGVKNKKG